MCRWRRSPRARRAQIARNAAGVIAVELIAAAQGIDYHAPLKTSPKLQAIHDAVRAHSARTSLPTAIGPTRWARFRRAVLAGEDRRARGLSRAQIDS